MSSSCCIWKRARDTFRMQEPTIAPLHQQNPTEDNCQHRPLGRYHTLFPFPRYADQRNEREKARHMTLHISLGVIEEWMGSVLKLYRNEVLETYRHTHVIHVHMTSTVPSCTVLWPVLIFHCGKNASTTLHLKSCLIAFCDGNYIFNILISLLAFSVLNT